MNWEPHWSPISFNKTFFDKHTYSNLSPNQTSFAAAVRGSLRHNYLQICFYQDSVCSLGGGAFGGMKWSKFKGGARVYTNRCTLAHSFSNFAFISFSLIMISVLFASNQQQWWQSEMMAETKALSQGSESSRVPETISPTVNRWSEFSSQKILAL